ncbi:MAG: Soluble attachment protein [Acidobacteriota bacterium]|nr:Soluble attachment protein [Acidobacteriota bacterium]
MAGGHIPEELLGRFLRADISKEDARGVLRHLLSRCPECLALSSRMTAELGLYSKTTTWEEAYEEVFARTLAFATEQEERLAVEKLRGWGQWAALEPASPQERFAVVAANPRYYTYGFYQRLLEASRWYIHTDPAEAVDVVRLAIMVAERLDPALVGEKRIADLRAAAWASLGNARRLASDFEGSRHAFNETWRILEEEGTNDPLDRAHVIGLESGYMQDMGEFETAEASLEEALEIYRALHDTHLQGRTLLKMGDCIGQIYPERGIARIRQALPLIDVAKERRLDLCAQHDLAWFLNDNGQPEEALVVLDRARPVYQQFPDKWTQLRLHWLEGRIAANLGDLAEAESIFGQIWDEFRARNLNHELVLVSIDLAEVLVAQEQGARAATLIKDCYPIMQAWRLHRYALAAWIVFEKAVAQGQASEIFRRIRGYYRRYWSRPVAFGEEPR